MKRFLNHAVSLSLLVLYTVSQLVLLIEAIGCHVSPLFYLFAALLCLTGWITTGTRRGWMVGLPSSVLLLCLSFYVFPDNLTQQFNDAFDRLTGVYLEQVVYPGNTYDYLNLASDHSLLFLLLAFLLASYMGSALSSRSGRVGLALLGSVPLFAACLTVTIHPSIPAIVGMLLFWLLLAAGGSRYQEADESYRSVLGLLLPIALLLGLLIWRIDPERYQYEPMQLDLTERLDELVQKLDERWNELFSDDQLSRLSQPENFDGTEEQSVPDEALWQSQRGQLELSQPFDRDDQARVYLRVRADRSGLVYLRAVSYGDYLGTAWAVSQEDSSVSSLGFTASALSGSESGSIRIEMLADSEYRYLPYFSLESDGSDSFVPAGRTSSYSAAYIPFPRSFEGAALSAPYADSELQYRAYAHEVYTRLPSDTRAALTNLIEEAGLRDTDDLIRDVAAYVQQTGTYSLDTLPYPSSDYALYFLTTAREGWCLHFATAAAALYRTLGIPARIVEGFLADAEAGRFVEVKGENAHAWVEVYQDGLGWLPVEVTGQSGRSSDALGAGEATPEPTPEPTPAPESAPGEAELTPVLPVETVQPSIPVGVLTQDTLEEATSSAQNRGFTVPIWISAVLLLAAILPLRRLILLKLRKRSFEQPDAGRAVVALYRCASIAAALGLTTPPELISLAEKAAFSRSGVSEEERKRCRAVYEQFLEDGEPMLRRLDRFRLHWLYVLK